MPKDPVFPSNSKLTATALNAAFGLKVDFPTAFVIGQTYAPPNTVKYNDTWYYCVAEVQDAQMTPDNDTGHWQPMPNSGPPGPPSTTPGPPGPSGPPGPPGSAAPAWSGSNTTIGNITSTIAENVINLRTLAAGTMPPKSSGKAELRLYVPSDSIHGRKFARLCVREDTSQSLLVTLAPAQTGIVIIEFWLFVGTSTSNQSETYVRLNSGPLVPNGGLPPTAQGAVAWDFLQNSASLEARVWRESTSDTITARSINWTYNQPN